jgi:hypothetical protein
LVDVPRYPAARELNSISRGQRLVDKKPPLPFASITIL